MRVRNLGVRNLGICRSMRVCAMGVCSVRLRCVVNLQHALRVGGRLTMNGQQHLLLTIITTTQQVLTRRIKQDVSREDVLGTGHQMDKGHQV